MFFRWTYNSSYCGFLVVSSFVRNTSPHLLSLSEWNVYLVPKKRCIPKSHWNIALRITWHLCFRHNASSPYSIFIQMHLVLKRGFRIIIKLEPSYSSILHILGNVHIQKIELKSIKVRVKIQFFYISHIFEIRFISHALKGWMHPCKHYKTNNMHPFIIIFLPRQDLALLSYKRSDMAQFIV